MRTKLLFVTLGIACCAGVGARADVLEMQNGDRYSGQVLAVSAEAVVLKSEILGRITVPRGKVATVTFSTSGSAAAKAPENLAVPEVTKALSAPSPSIIVGHTNADLPGVFRQLGGDTNAVSQVRQQFLTGSPEAAAKYDEMVNGLLNGQLNLADLRRQAQASAQQIRDLQHQLAPETDETLDAYLKILDTFVNDAGAGDGKTASSP
jgi:hypothetical protein